MQTLARQLVLCTLAGLALSLSRAAGAETVNVAVASNFVAALESIKVAFEAESPHDLRIIRGSSGKHYAQIVNGAPFDVFLSADQLRPRRLMAEGMAVPHSQRTYALGQLALWSRVDGLSLGEEYLTDTDNYGVIAIANPRLAPYGQAALQTFEYLGISEQLQSRLVLGENIAQAFQFAYSGNADLGLIAYSQTVSVSAGRGGSSWKIPGEFHEPIRQDMVLLTNSAAAREFATFMGSTLARGILSESGYLVPDASE